MLEGGIVSNLLCLQTSFGSIKIGNLGVFTKKDLPKQELGQIPLFTIPFFGCPIPLSLNFEISGEIGFSIEYDNAASSFSITLNGQLSANVDVEAGIGSLVSISVGANGVLIGVQSTSKIEKNSLDEYIPTHSIDIAGGEITLYIQGKVSFWTIFYLDMKVFNGWSKTISLP